MSLHRWGNQYSAEEITCPPTVVLVLMICKLTPKSEVYHPLNHTLRLLPLILNIKKEERWKKRGVQSREMCTTTFLLAYWTLSLQNGLISWKRHDQKIQWIFAFVNSRPHTCQAGLTQLSKSPAIPLALHIFIPLLLLLSEGVVEILFNKWL